MSRILALDFGVKRIGVAVSDELKLFASPYKTIEFENNDKLLAELHTIVTDQGIEKIVVGLPKYYDGTDSPQTIRVKAFINLLRKKIPVTVETFDERYSSIEASELLNKKKEDLRKHKGLIDQLAASIILQNYLDTTSPE